MWFLNEEIKMGTFAKWRYPEDEDADEEEEVMALKY